MKRTIIWTALLLAGGCASRNTDRTVDPVRVETLLAAPSAAVSEAVYVGTIEEEASAALSFPVPGTVARTCADEGQRVRQGELLAELDPTSARQTFEAAEAALEQARDACGRLQKLHDAKTLPEIQWVEAQTRLRQAEAAAEIARKNLKDCTLRAPFTGVVGVRRASAGETVLPGVPVMTLLRIEKVKVRFPVPEQEIAAIGADSRVQLTVPALADRTFSAAKIEKGAVANPASHTYDVRATVANAAGELLPGMVCRVVVTPEGAIEQIVVPVRAVQQAGDGSRYVWIVRGDSAVRATVSVGRFSGNGVELTAGVEPGERIITGGMQKIGEGTKTLWR
ncbi:efflux RND transporter periplasmic adaptor subunit [Alistipes sp.]|uniref:efflux RND transporter periplasmic adaptor subunit n=1 Tax=Alistipes sp. TaxID=1872444 RepID=UPI003AF0B20A